MGPYRAASNLTDRSKQRLCWLAGRFAAKLGSTRLAERRFLKAFMGFLKLGAPVEQADASKRRPTA